MFSKSHRRRKNPTRFSGGVSTHYVYRGAHATIMRDRRRWFERLDQPILALWRIPAGHLPTIEEAKERLAHLQQHGSTSFAFSFNKPFPSPEYTSTTIDSSGTLLL